MSYAILTDSACDLPYAMLQELGVEIVPLNILIGEEVFADDLTGTKHTTPEIYDRLRSGEKLTTAALNVAEMQAAMRPHLDAGEDVLVLSFSSALSGTCSFVETAARLLQEEYPQRRIYVVDSLSASMGQGLLAYLTARQREAGADVEQAYRFAMDTRLKICHWFTVDDLQFLRRGGRLSASAAAIGSVLSIKPVMRMNDQGALEPVMKVQGRKTALRTLVKKMQETAVDPAGQTIFVSHGDCLADAEYLAAQIREKMGVTDIHIHFIGPAIACHSGPGTAAIFFLAEHR